MECTPSNLLTTSLFIRLVILGFLAFGLFSMAAIRDLVSQITAGSVSWPGWNVVHADFGRVDQIPRGIWAGRGMDSGFGVELKRWVSVGCALAAFLVLGTTREAGERYSAFGRMILRIPGGKDKQQDQGSGDIKRCVPWRYPVIVLTLSCRDSADVVKAYYTHEEIVLPIIKKHHEQFPSPSSTPSLPPSPTISRTPSVNAGPTSLFSPPKSSLKVPEQRLNPYGPSYGTRAAIKPEEVTKGRTPPTPTSPGFVGGDALGALLSSSYKNKGERGKGKDGKKEKVMPKVMMSPF